MPKLSRPAVFPRVTAFPWVSLCIGLACAVVSVAAWVGPHHLVRHAAQFRGADLYSPGLRFLWRLPASAFLTHSVPDLLWTLTICATVFVLVERRLGSVGLLAVVSAGHVSSTLVIDEFAHRDHLLGWLHSGDFGSSCMVFAAVTALILLTGSRLLALGLATMYAVDLATNAPLTIAEHSVAVLAGAGVCIAFALANGVRIPLLVRLGLRRFSEILPTGAGRSH